MRLHYLSECVRLRVTKGDTIHNLTETQARRYYAAETEHVRQQTTFEQWVDLSDVVLTSA